MEAARVSLAIWKVAPSEIDTSVKMGKQKQEQNFLNCHTIDEAWYRTCRLCQVVGREYVIERGSFVGSTRRQLGNLAIVISHPWERPLGITYRGMVVSTDDAIQEYFEHYLIGTEKAPNEQYTYGERIASPIETDDGPMTPLQIIAGMLRETPATNQAVIEVARPEDILLDDPPCLRLLDWKAEQREDKEWVLNLTTCWRSWDVPNGLPTNLGGIQLLNEAMAEWASRMKGNRFRPGKLIAYSSGAHLYEHSLGLPPFADLSQELLEKSPV